LTAVSETSNNVVVHAYGGTPGPLSVSVATGPDGLDVVIQDRGEGIQQVIASADRTGLGLGVITALADRAEFASRPGGGTDVRMSFLSRGSTSSKGDWTTHKQADQSLPLPGRPRGHLRLVVNCRVVDVTDPRLDPLVGHEGTRTVAFSFGDSATRIVAPLSSVIRGTR
jgi:Histidine kinase-like ATPase domain